MAWGPKNKQLGLQPFPTAVHVPYWANQKCKVLELVSQHQHAEEDRTRFEASLAAATDLVKDEAETEQPEEHDDAEVKTEGKGHGKRAKRTGPSGGAEKAAALMTAVTTIYLLLSI